MPKITLGEYRAKHSQDNAPEAAPTTYWTRSEGDTITYVFDGREVEYEEYIALLAKDTSSGRDPKDTDIMISETPAPGTL